MLTLLSSLATDGGRPEPTGNVLFDYQNIDHRHSGCRCRVGYNFGFGFHQTRAPKSGTKLQ